MTLRIRVFEGYGGCEDVRSVKLKVEVWCGGEVRSGAGGEVDA